MKPKFAVVGLLSLTAVGLSPGLASAIPKGLLLANQISNVEQVRWVCNPWGTAAGGSRTTIAPAASIPSPSFGIALGTHRGWRQ
jgi:hypothetical protein